MRNLTFCETAKRNKKSIKHEKHYFCKVNGEGRHDIGNNNMIQKVNCNTVRMSHYGDGLNDGDTVRMYNINPYMLIFEGIYQSGDIILGG